MSVTDNNGLQRAGEVRIEELKLISSSNDIIDLSEFLVELNVFEDIFTNYLYGSVVLTDSRNLIDKFNIHGEELLNVRLRTPSFPDTDVIKKTFRVFRISDRDIVRDTSTQNFVLHFCSIELFYDVLMPLFVAREGNITDVASGIFSDFVSSARNFDILEDNETIQESEVPTDLVIINETINKVKFVSPGWSPFKCLNWLATKAIPADGTSKSFLFFETNKNFYFGTVESLFKQAYENGNYIGRYTIAASNIREEGKGQNINRELFLAKDVTMSETTDYIKNYTNGYLANRLVYLDLYNKEYKLIDYDHVDSYDKQFHSSGDGEKARPSFDKNTFRNAATNISFYPKNPKLFDGVNDNVSDRMGEIYGNRKSSMLELTNLKMNITVPGRTDIEAGRLLYFDYPALGGKSEEDTTQTQQDKLYSGYYLITAIHHKVTKIEHSMIMEIVKDSLEIDSNKTSAE